MKASDVRPITYLKNSTAKVVKEVFEHRRPMVITQNGEAKAVIQDVASYEETQETMALLKILALGTREVAQGRVTPLRAVVARLRRARD